MTEQRKNRRLKLESTLIIKRIDESIGDEITVSIADLSKKGLGFQCDKVIEIGAIYEGEIVIWTKEKIHFLIEIVRIKKCEDTYVYGTFFVGMPEAEVQKISIYETFEFGIK